jgi:peptidoglycan-associated lipoprotein
MQTHDFKLKQLRTLGIILTCGALAAGCAGNSVKPMTQEVGPVASATEQTVPISVSETKPAQPVATESTTAPVDDTQAATTETPEIIADKTTDSEDVTVAQQPAQMTFYFGFNKTQLDDQDKDILKEHARFLKANPSLVLEINGHTDHKGPHAYNEYLSKQRAESVAKVLIADGIPRSQLIINALADNKPLADQTDPSKNRRVELQYDEMNMLSVK